MYHSFLIHSSVDGHLGCFHVPVINNYEQCCDEHWGIKTRQPFQIKLLEIQENIDLNECQSWGTGVSFPSGLELLFNGHKFSALENEWLGNGGEVF